MADKKTILVVEDEKDLAQALKIKLEEAGFVTLVAYDGESGLRIALAEHPDLVLLDILLPGMDGMELLKQLREDEWGREAKVILLTNVDNIETIAKVIEDEGYEYLVKTDWKMDDVVAKIKNKLGVD